jgi:hypothetical protein
MSSFSRLLAGLLSAWLGEEETDIIRDTMQNPAVADSEQTTTRTTHHDRTIPLFLSLPSSSKSERDRMSERTKITFTRVIFIFIIHRQTNRREDHRLSSTKPDHVFVIDSQINAGGRSAWVRVIRQQTW